MPEETALRPHLGLVCMTISDRVRFRTITRTRYLKLAEDEKWSVLRELYADNLRRLVGALDFCNEQQIKLYRLSSALFPMSDEAIGTSILDEMSAELAQVGKKSAESGIRIVMHPDQFVVLNSDTPQVVETSKKILGKHAYALDLMGLPRSAWTTMMIHGGKSDRIEQIIQTISQLPLTVKNRLALENDEYSYGANQILEVCRRAGIPMVFDVHHYVCYEGMQSYEDPALAQMLAAARQTWPDPGWQLVHLSNGREAFGDRKHSDFISVVPSALEQAPWIEVEAKNKEEAIARLRADWPIAQ